MHPMFFAVALVLLAFVFLAYCVPLPMQIRDALWKTFEAHGGPVRDVYVLTDFHTGNLKGYAFVHFRHSLHADQGKFPSPCWLSVFFLLDGRGTLCILFSRFVTVSVAVFSLGLGLSGSLQRIRCMVAVSEKFLWHRADSFVMSFGRTYRPEQTLTAILGSSHLMPPVKF